MREKKSSHNPFTDTFPVSFVEEEGSVVENGVGVIVRDCQRIRGGQLVGVRVCTGRLEKNGRCVSQGYAESGSRDQTKELGFD